MYKQINIHTQARASRFINLFQTSVRLCTVYIDVLHELALSQIVLLRVLTAHARAAGFNTCANGYAQQVVAARQANVKWLFSAVSL